MSTNPPRKSWRDEQGRAESPAGRPPKRSRQSRIVGILFAMLAIAGALIALFFWLGPVDPPLFIPIVLSQYTDPHYPPNAWAAEDAANLRSEDLPWRPDNPFANQQLDQLRLKLTEVKNSAAETVVVYLGGNAVAVPNETGALAVYLLPADASPDQKPAERWVPISEVLKAVGDSPAKRKVLFLDVYRRLADARLGMLRNEVAQALDPELAQAVKNHDNLWIIAACSPGQVSLASEELGRSVFAYFLENGLRGAAVDSEARTVRVQQLFAYVKTQVDRWTKLNRDARQTPKLYHAEGAKDADLLLVPPERTEAAARPLSKVYPDWLARGWELRDQWRGEKTALVVPCALPQLEATLLLAEQRWVGGAVDGVPLDASKRFLQDQVATLSGLIQKGRAAVPNPAPRSLALAEAQGQRPEQPSAPDPKEKDKKPEPTVAALVETLWQLRTEPMKFTDAREKYLKQVKDKPFDVAKAVFELALRENRPRPDDILGWNDLFPSGGATLYVETYFLQRLTEMARQAKSGAIKDWGPLYPVIYRALEVVRDGERAAAGWYELVPRQTTLALDGRAFVWVQSRLDQAAQLRHEGETLLLARGYAPLGRAKDLLDQAFNAYQEINGFIESLQRSYAAYDDALVYLPGYAHYLLHRPDLDPDEETVWAKAVQESERLYRLLRSQLDKPFGKTPAAIAPEPGDLARLGGELDKQARDVDAQLSSLRRPFADARVKELMDRADRGEERLGTYLQIRSLLACPCLTAPNRLALWKAGRKLGDKLHTDPPAQEVPLPDYDNTLRTLADQQDRQRGARRARLVIALLRLGGARTGDLSAGQSIIEDRPDAEEKDWHALGQQLRQALGELGQQIETEREKNPLAAEQLARVLHPFDMPQSSAVSDLAQSPTLRLRGQEARGVWTWLGDQCLHESRDLADPRVYQGWATHYHSAAFRPSEMFRVAERIPKPFSTFAGQVSFLADARQTLQVSLKPPARLQPTDQLGIVTAGDQPWLRIPEPVKLEDLKARAPADQEEWKTPLAVQLLPDYEQLESLPKGFLVQARLDGRTFHYRIDAEMPTPLSRQFRIYVSDNPAKAVEPVGDFRLRTVDKQRFFCYVKAPPGEAKRAVLELRVDDALVAKSDVIEFPPDGETKVILKKEATPTSGDKPLDSISLQSSQRLKLQLRQLDDKAKGPDKLLAERSLGVSIAAPGEYVEPPRVTFEPASADEDGKNRLAARVKLRRPISGEPPRVLLTISPEHVRGFLRADGAGTTPSGILSADPAQEVVLKYVDLRFRDDLDENGLVFLNIDGYERAFTFQTTFRRQGQAATALGVSLPSLRLKPRVVRDKQDPSKAEVLVYLEADHPQLGDRIELYFDRDGINGFSEEEKIVLPSPRREAIAFRPIPEGGTLEFKASIEDWQIGKDRSRLLDAANLTGPRNLRARLVDAAGIPRAGTESIVRVFLDATPPDQVRFVGLGALTGDKIGPSPVKLERDKQLEPLLVKVAAADKDSPIKTVNLYLAELDENGNLPPKAKPEPAAPDETRKLWTTKLNLPAAKRKRGDPAEVSLIAEVINEADGATLRQITLELVDPPPDDPKKPTAIIEGVTTLIFEDRPLKQSTVFLKDNNKPMLKPISKTSGDKGEFEFVVAPGSYTLSAVDGSRRSKEVAFEIGAGERRKETLILK